MTDIVINISFRTMIISLIVYSLFGFICYGLILANQKYYDLKRQLELGLSKEALEFKPISKNSNYKILFLITCLVFSGFILLDDFRNNRKIDYLSFKHGFKIW